MCNSVSIPHYTTLHTTDIIADLDLYRHGLTYLNRDPSSFTPTKLDGPYGGKSLVFHDDQAATLASIRQFSSRDADRYVEYERFLGLARDLVRPLLDHALPLVNEGTLAERIRHSRAAMDVIRTTLQSNSSLLPFYSLLTGNAAHLLDTYFESDLLKSTLATDSVIGANLSPSMTSSSYV
jgi:phytoene dehydrogenase-like protein